MARYYVNNIAQSNGDHEVHRDGCIYMPQSRTDLGEHATCQTAVQAAKRIYPRSDGCYWCARDCHTG